MNTKLVSVVLALAGSMAMVMGAEVTPVPKGGIKPPDDDWKGRIAELAPDNQEVAKLLQRIAQKRKNSGE